MSEKGLRRYHEKLSALPPKEQLNKITAARPEKSLRALVSEDAPQGLILRFAPLLNEASTVELTPVEKARVLRAQGKSDDAKAILAADADAGNQKSVLALQKIKFDEAVRISPSTPDQELASYVVATVWETITAYEEALEEDEDMDTEETHATLADAHIFLGEDDTKVLHHLQQAQEKTGDEAKKYFYSGMVALIQRNPKECLRIFDQAAHQGCLDAIPYCMQSTINPEEKQQYLELGIKYGNTSYYIELGALQTLQKDTEGAIVSYKNAIRAGHITQGTVLQPLIQLLVEAGREDEITQICQGLMEAGKIEGFQGMAYKAHLQGNQQEIGYYIQQAADAGLKSLSSIQRVRTLMLQEKFIEAIEECEKMLPQSPTPEVYFTLFILYRETNNTEEAKKYFALGIQASGLEDDWKECQDLMQQGKLKEAARLLIEKIISRFSLEVSMSPEEIVQLSEEIAQSRMN